jgi:hypothetical protein
MGCGAEVVGGESGWTVAVAAVIVAVVDTIFAAVDCCSW